MDEVTAFATALVKRPAISADVKLDRSDHHSGQTSPMPSSVSSQSSTTFASAHSSPSDVTTSSMQSSNLAANHPIPPASEPKQFRAIGLIYAKYEPSEESFTRGFLKTDDEQAIDAVLLGRVMSLVKKHLDLDKPHLWVVYPRTREKHNELHAQVVGVWEPETLAASDDESAAASEETTEAAAESTESVEAESDRTETTAESVSGSETEEKTPADVADATADSDATEPAADAVETTSDDPDAEDSSSPQLLSKPTLVAPIRPATPAPAPTPAPAAPAAAAPPPPPQDGYFSVRGEIIGASEERQQVTVRIQQAPRKTGADPRSFKLQLSGTLNGRLVGHFWDLQVKRQADHLVIQEGTRIGIAPPRHKPKTKSFPKKKRGPNKKSIKPQMKGSAKHSSATSESADDPAASVAKAATPTEATPDTTTDPNAIAMPAEAPNTTPVEASPETTEAGVTPSAAVTETPTPTEETAPTAATEAPTVDPVDESAVAQTTPDVETETAETVADVTESAEADGGDTSEPTAEQGSDDADAGQSKSRRIRKSKTDE